jgi:arylsulfatase A-like enzyme
MYLQSAHQVDAFLEELWKNAQANPVTRDKTTLIVTTDHGRGVGAKWTDHGEKVDGAERIWMAVMGPDIAPIGVRRDTPATQSQVAATIAAVLGLDWPKAEPRAAKPLPVFNR